MYMKYKDLGIIIGQVLDEAKVLYTPN